MKVYQALYSKLASIERLRERGTTSPWIKKHAESFYEIKDRFFPNGSGFDGILEIEKAGNDLIVQTSYHTMDEYGCYAGWIENIELTFSPNFETGIELSSTTYDDNSDLDNFMISKLIDHIETTIYSAMTQFYNEIRTMNL